MVPAAHSGECLEVGDNATVVDNGRQIIRPKAGLTGACMRAHWALLLRACHCPWPTTRSYTADILV